MAVHSAFQDEADQHGIVDRRDPKAFPGEDHGVVFDVLADLQDARVLQYRLQKRQRLILVDLLRRLFAAA